MLLFSCFCMSIALVSALPQGSPSTTSSLNVDDPSSGDPTTPPKTLTAPSKPPNPWASGGIPTAPAACTDSSNPSDDCFNALATQAQDGVHTAGGYLSHDGTCTGTQGGQLETAAWDASTLANYVTGWPANARGIAAGKFYMGLDFPTQQQRINDNFGRAANFKIQGNSYITTSCKDTKTQCNIKKDGKAVGGYAWTYSGWFGYYHYITLCPTFFTIDTLDTQLQQREAELAAGDTSKVTDMRYLKSSGQFFLHEMMHTQLVGQPHIIDERVQNDDTGKWAYGPSLVHQLAKRSLSQGGGATRASMNADSYAMLANALYWWDVTNYFPGVPGKDNPFESASDAVLDESPISFYADLGNVTDLGSVDFTNLFNVDTDGFADEATSTSASSTPATPTPIPSPSPSAPSPLPPPSSPSSVADSCGDSYKFFFDHFEIHGKNFDASKFGADGSGLKENIQGCGVLTTWSFQQTPTDPNYQWFASGNLPIGTKACVGRAVVSAGGQSPDGCTGAG